VYQRAQAANEKPSQEGFFGSTKGSRSQETKNALIGGAFEAKMPENARK
jgi:hypothetical protein